MDEGSTTTSFAVHLVAAAAVAFGHRGPAALAEAIHQWIDAFAHAAALQPLLARLCGHQHTLAFGAARLHLLAALIGATVAAAVALCIVCDALIGLVPTATAAATPPLPWAVPACAAVASLLAPLHPRSPPRDRVARRAALRLALLLLCASVARWPAAAAAAAAGPGSTIHQQRLAALAGWIERPPAAALRLLAHMLRRPDASAGALLAGVAVLRAGQAAAEPARLLLQASPRGAQLAELQRLAARARALPGVLELRDLRFWCVDADAVVGSLVVLVDATAEPQRTLRHVRRTFGAALAELTVQVETEDDGDDEFECVRL